MPALPAWALCVSSCGVCVHVCARGVNSTHQLLGTSFANVVDKLPNLSRPGVFAIHTLCQRQLFRAPLPPGCDRHALLCWGCVCACGEHQRETTCSVMDDAARSGREKPNLGVIIRLVLEDLLDRSSKRRRDRLLVKHRLPHARVWLVSRHTPVSRHGFLCRRP